MEGTALDLGSHVPWKEGSQRRSKHLREQVNLNVTGPTNPRFHFCERAARHGSSSKLHFCRESVLRPPLGNTSAADGLTDRIPTHVLLHKRAKLAGEIIEIALL